MNRATRVIVATMGVILGISGLNHGVFEILQGNAVTEGLIIQAIGPAQRMWHYGTEEAFTLIPRFLVTGVLAVIVSLAIVGWSIGFVHTKYGARVFGLLFVLLFLVGGGIAAQVVFAPVAWGAATRVNRPLSWWQGILPAGARQALAKIWPVTLALGSLSLVVGLFIAITGYVPGQSDPERILGICWAFVFLGGLGSYLLTLVSGFACDIQKRVADARQAHGALA